MQHDAPESHVPTYCQGRVCASQPRQPGMPRPALTYDVGRHQAQVAPSLPVWCYHIHRQWSPSVMHVHHRAHYSSSATFPAMLVLDRVVMLACHMHWRLCCWCCGVTCWTELKVVMVLASCKIKAPGSKAVHASVVLTQIASGRRVTM